MQSRDSIEVKESRRKNGEDCNKSSLKEKLGKRTVKKGCDF